MTNEKNVASGVIRHQRLQPLMMGLLVNYGVAHLVFLHRKVAVEQVGGQALRVRDRVFRAAIPCATQLES